MKIKVKTYSYQNLGVRKQIDLYQDWGEENGLITKRNRRIFWRNGTLAYPNCGVVIQLYVFFKTDRTRH